MFCFILNQLAILTAWWLLLSLLWMKICVESTNEVLCALQIVTELVVRADLSTVIWMWGSSLCLYVLLNAAQKPKQRGCLELCHCLEAKEDQGWKLSITFNDISNLFTARWPELQIIGWGLAWDVGKTCGGCCPAVWQGRWGERCWEVLAWQTWNRRSHRNNLLGVEQQGFFMMGIHLSSIAFSRRLLRCTSGKIFGNAGDAGDLGSIPGSRRSLEEKMATIPVFWLRKSWQRAFGSP